jgi:hypothetical protein
MIINCARDGLDFDEIASKVARKYQETYPAAMLERLYNQEKDKPKWNKEKIPVLSEKDLEDFRKWQAWKDSRKGRQ